MIIKLNKLRIANFMGIKSLEIDFNGKDTDIYGNNGTGKTTIENAWRWLLFNKNSENKDDTNFTIKPQDEHGKDIMSTESLVEAELTVDGKPLKLKKIRAEKWTKRQGTGETVFDGHVRKYWFDEEPVSATAYKTKLEELLPEDLFKKITNPLYFNTQIDWKQRLEMLYEIYIKETDEEIIEKHPTIASLAKTLDGKSIESFENIIKDKLKGLKQEKLHIPSRIDEITMSIPQESPDYEKVQADLEQLKNQLSEIESSMMDATKRAAKRDEKYQELYSLRDELDRLKQTIKANINSGRAELLEERSETSEGILVLDNGLRMLQGQIDALKSSVDGGVEQLEGLRGDYSSLIQEKFDTAALSFEGGEVETQCPTCKQELPEEIINGSMDALKEQFEENKLSKLKSIDARIQQNKESGSSLKAKVEQMKSEREQLENELVDKEAKLESLKKKLSNIDDELQKPAKEPDYASSEEYNQLIEKIGNLETELKTPPEDNSEILQQKASLQAKIDELNKVIINKEEIESKKARIDFLKSEETRVAFKIAELEGQLHLIDQFYLIKTEMVNKHFTHVRFRFFEENSTNDGRQKMCVAEVNTNGSYVKFDDANTAGQVNAGLNIINILCDFYGVRAPIFVDNAERITDLIETESQVVRLIKPEIRSEDDRKKYSKLVVEIKEDE